MGFKSIVLLEQLFIFPIAFVEKKYSLGFLSDSTNGQERDFRNICKNRTEDIDRFLGREEKQEKDYTKQKKKCYELSS